MKAFSYILAIYMGFLLALPMYETMACDHDSEKSEEACGHDKSPCCPPYTFCKVCATYVIFPTAVNYLKDRVPELHITITAYAEYFYISPPVSIWIPPQLI